MKEILINVLSSSLFQALLVAVVSSYVTIKIKQTSDKNKSDKDLRLELQAKLMNLNLYYGFLAGYELRKEEFPSYMEDKVQLDRFGVSDIARKIDKTDLKEALEILFLEKYTYRERYHETSRIIDKFSHQLTPSFKKIMRDINDENERYLMSKFK